MPKLAYHNSAAVLAKHAHGMHDKDLAVVHETVSPDVKGWADVDGIDTYLASKDYGIHSVNDAEGHIAWALGLGRAVFWQAGGVNVRSVGIEQVSNIMLRSPSNVVRRKVWAARHPQLRATAKTLAAWHNADPKRHPLVYSDGTRPGVTSHWNVSQHFSASEGHTDCWPVHLGGYYPLLEVIAMARVYAKLGYRF
jgi:hypothetical protein